MAKDEPSDNAPAASFSAGQAGVVTPLPWLEPEFERIPRTRLPDVPGQSYRVDDVPRLYLEDVVAIFQLLRDNTKSVSMQTDEFRIHNPKQLRYVPQERIDQLSIQSSEPNIWIEIHERWHRVTTFDDAPEVSVLAEDILAIFQRRKAKKPTWLKMSPFVLAAAIFLLLLILIRSTTIPSMVSIALLYATFLIPLFYWLLLEKIRTRPIGAVIPMYKKETPRAWYVSDNFKIAATTAVITAIVTAVLTVAATLLFLQGKT